MPPSVPTRDHYGEFIDAVLNRQTTPTSGAFHVTGPLTEVVLSGTVALYFHGETLAWDARRMSFTDHKAANAFLNTSPARGGSRRGSRVIRARQSEIADSTSTSCGEIDECG